MSRLFGWCNKLTSLDMSNWYTNKVTDMGNMFNACRLLTSLDLSNWNLSSAENVSTMFESCLSLVNLNLNGWHLKENVSITNLFNKCDKLMFVNLKRSDAFTVNKFIQALPTRSKDNKGYINIKYVDDFVDVNMNEALSKWWTVFRSEGHIANICIGHNNLSRTLLQDKKIKNIYIGNSDLL
jgi:surface protein